MTNKPTSPLTQAIEALERIVDLAEGADWGSCKCEPMVLSTPEHSHPGYRCEACQIADEIAEAKKQLTALRSLRPATEEEISQEFGLAITKDKVRGFRAAEAKRIIEDAARLDFMAFHGYWIGWNKEGEECRLWHHPEEGNPEPVFGWKRWFPNARAAIDAARQEDKT